ncbi:hypothetical protein CYMTET_56287 [Cymbomonas tetramitiformis]|uniref:Uncharacterized protein n=1 Tax=Cymbomonas tetramitiformis TaxID=36881 RepID=A0AAE0BB87_9CHLO|nr:hypothetical protein CYMTET_56287 [Cymbomonas tetramitiformis]
MPSATLTGFFGFRIDDCAQNMFHQVKKTPAINQYGLKPMSFDEQEKRIHDKGSPGRSILGCARKRELFELSLPSPLGRQKRTAMVRGTLLLSKVDVKIVKKYTHEDTHRTLHPVIDSFSCL